MLQHFKLTSALGVKVPTIKPKAPPTKEIIMLVVRYRKNLLTSKGWPVMKYTITLDIVGNIICYRNILQFFVLI